MHENTLYAIAIHKNRFITPFLILWSHFENRTKNLLSILQLLRTCHIHNSVFPVLHTTNWLVYTLNTLNMYFEFLSLAEIQVFSQRSQYGAFYHNLGE